MKALILNNQARAMSIFWRVLIKKMIGRKMDVTCCVPEGDPESENLLRNYGASIVNFKLDRKGINPFRDFFTYRQLKRILAREKPDLLFTSTIKPVIYGCFAAKSENVPGIFATITGLGFVFEQDNFQKKVLHWLGASLYKMALKNISAVFFQNRDDAEIFKRDRILAKDQKTFFVPGTGVDVDFFQPVSFPEGSINFLLVGRLLEAKGLQEFETAASQLKKEFPNCRFLILGIPEKGPGSVPLEKIRAWERNGSIEYLGETRDVRPFIAQSHIAVLPSWREGVPTSLMEAMSMGRPIIAADSPGCREVVRSGENGFLCKVKNPQSLAGEMKKFILNPELIPVMGAKSRQLASEIFDAEKVAEEIIEDMLGTMKMRTAGVD